MLICRDCCTLNDPRARTLPGSGWIELVLWLAWLVPGIIYSIWRRGGRPACRSCGSRALLPVESPLGRRLAEQNPQPAPPARLEPGPASRPLPRWASVLGLVGGAALVVSCVAAHGG